MAYCAAWAHSPIYEQPHNPSMFWGPRRTGGSAQARRCARGGARRHACSLGRQQTVKAGDARDLPVAWIRLGSNPLVLSRAARLAGAREGEANHERRADRSHPHHNVNKMLNYLDGN
jgi:hypothetical protein